MARSCEILGQRTIYLSSLLSLLLFLSFSSSISLSNSFCLPSLKVCLCLAPFLSLTLSAFPLLLSNSVFLYLHILSLSSLSYSQTLSLSSSLFYHYNSLWPSSLTLKLSIFLPLCLHSLALTFSCSHLLCPLIFPLLPLMLLLYPYFCSIDTMWCKSCCISCISYHCTIGW